MASRPTWTRRIGMTLMAGSAAAMAAVGTPAVAQDAPEPVEVTVESTALIASPVTDAVPDTLTNSFPPQVVCVLFAEACPESTAEIREQVGDVIGTVDENAPAAPVQPARPETLAVSYQAGNTRYQSALKFSLPDVPEGEEIDSFLVSIGQTQPTYAVNSPAFQQAVTAAIALASTQDPQAFQTEFTKALEQEPAAQPDIGIEACPFTKPFPEAPPPQSIQDSELPTEQENDEQVPALDCLRGANGVFDEEAGTWTFDLTFAAQAWNDGTLENHGILLRPTGAENLAFGDPDTSTNAQISLDVSTPPKAQQQSSAPPPPPAPLAPAPEPEAEPAPQSAPATTSPSSGQADSEPVSTGLFSAADPEPVEEDVAAEEPAVAPDEGAATGDNPPPTALGQTPAAADGEGVYVLPWLLVPLFAAGIYLVTRSLTAEAEVETAAAGGALTKLLQRAEPQGA